MTNRETQEGYNYVANFQNFIKEKYTILKYDAK